MRYSSKVKAVINAGSAGPPLVSCQNPWLHTCFSLTQEGPLLNWNLGREVEGSVSREGSEQLRKARQSDNLPPGSTPWSGCGPRLQRALDSEHRLCHSAVTPLPRHQCLRASAALVVGPPELEHARAPFQLQYLIRTSLCSYGTGSPVEHCLTENPPRSPDTQPYTLEAASGSSLQIILS